MALLSPTRPRATPRPSAGVWPGLFDVPKVPVHAAIARRLARAAVKNLPITLEFPDGDELGNRWPPAAAGPARFVLRPARRGRPDRLRRGLDDRRSDHRGLARHEPQCAARARRGPQHRHRVWPTGPPTSWRRRSGVLRKRMSVLVPRPLQTLRHTWQSRPPATEENTPTGARENIHRHYDLSNELFELFLDPSLTYSAAWFEPGDDLQRLSSARSTGSWTWPG